MLQHYADGGDVEIGGDAGWRDVCGQPTFNFGGYDYRIKPKPVEGWAVVWLNGCIGSVYKDREIPDYIASNHNVARIAKFREIEQ